VRRLGKRKKKKISQASKLPGAKEQPFNNPFAAIKKELKAKTAAQKPTASRAKKEPEQSPKDDAEAFAQAMAGVKPLNDDGTRMRQPDAESPPVRLDAEVEDDLEVMAQLADLIQGEELLDLRLTGQFSYGVSPGVSQALLDRLAEGDFPVQDYLDLHGMGVDEGLAEVERFFAHAASRGLRCVLIVHGKGKGSPLGIPLLKNQLERSLGQKRFQKRILAFCTARPVDGGSGAMYVLLRKWSGPKGAAWPAF
jgi:DNA-nicking Smr family endonuclease